MNRMPSLPMLRLFREVARAASFSEAARNCNISQPALSRAIQNMEVDLAARLFDRSTRRVVLTPAGAALLPIAERLESQLDDAFVELKSLLSGNRGKVMLGALPSLAAGSLPNLLMVHRDHFPEVDVAIVDGLAGDLYELLQKRKIDLAIATPVALSKDIMFEPLFTDQFVIVSKSGGIDAKRQSETWSAFQSAPFIALTKESSVRAATDAAFVSAKLSISPALECSNLATVGALVNAGMGIAALPASTLPMLSAYNLDWRPLTKPRIERVIGLAYLAKRTLSPAAAAMRELIIQQRAESWLLRSA